MTHSLFPEQTYPDGAMPKFGVHTSSEILQALEACQMTAQTADEAIENARKIRLQNAAAHSAFIHGLIESSSVVTD